MSIVDRSRYVMALFHSGMTTLWLYYGCYGTHTVGYKLKIDPYTVIVNQPI